MAPDRIAHRSQLAVDDLEELVSYYLKEAQPTDALRLMDNAERAFDQIIVLPKIGALLDLDELPYEDIRRWHIQGFKHLIIFYREVAGGIEIIRVLHSARDIPALLKASVS